MSTACLKHEQRRVIEFNILDNITTFGVLHTPTSSSTPYPLVTIFHGLASSKTGSKRFYVQLAEKLTANGIAVLRVDLPGHGDAEGILSDFSLSDYITSVNEIVSHARSLKHIDPKNMAIFGSSLGATLALLNAPYLPFIKTLALWAPTIQGILWLKESVKQSNNPIVSYSPSAEYIHYAGIPINKIFCSQFIEMDVTKETAKFPHSLSILYMQGENDPMVSLHHQKAFEKAMSSQPNSCTFRSYPNTDHNIPLTCAMLSELVEWFKDQLMMP